MLRGVQGSAASRTQSPATTATPVPLPCEPNVQPDATNPFSCIVAPRPYTPAQSVRIHGDGHAASNCTNGMPPRYCPAHPCRHRIARQCVRPCNAANRADHLAGQRHRAAACGAWIPTSVARSRNSGIAEDGKLCIGVGYGSSWKEQTCKQAIPGDESVSSRAPEHQASGDACGSANAVGGAFPERLNFTKTSSI